MLMNFYTSGPTFETSANVLATHPLISDLLNSLLLDNSSTLCTSGLTIIVKLLPIFAIHAREQLRNMLPTLLAILARILCWRDRHPASVSENELPIPEFEKHLEEGGNKTFDLRPDIHWEKLEMSFNAAASSAPSPRPYYTTLYYLYPSNVLKFLRGPVQYLVKKEVSSPFTVGWEQVISDETVRRKSEVWISVNRHQHKLIRLI